MLLKREFPKWFLTTKDCRIQGVKFIIFSGGDILRSLCSNLVFIFPFGIMKFLTEYLEWLWNYMTEIWVRVLANSFSGIHKSKIICSVSVNLLICDRKYIPHTCNSLNVYPKSTNMKYPILLSESLWSKYVSIVALTV